MTKSEQAAIDGVVEVMARELFEVYKEAANFPIPWEDTFEGTKGGWRRAERNCKYRARRLLSNLLKDGKVGIISSDQALSLLHLPDGSIDAHPALAIDRAKYYKQAQQDMIKEGWVKILVVPDSLEG